MALATIDTVSYNESFRPDWLEEGMFFHPHWIQYLDFFETIPNSIYYFMGVYIGIVGILGFLGNLLVLYFFATTKHLRTAPNMFIINMAISDCLFSILMGFPLMTISSFLKRWTFGPLACQLYAMLGGVFGFNSIGTLALISFDRYTVISNPFEAMKKCTKRRATIQIIGVWIWSFCWCIPPLFGWGQYIPEGLQVECSFDYITQDWKTYTHVMCMFVLGLCLPVFIIACSYIGIIRAVSRQAREMGKTAEKMGAKTTQSDKERRQDIQLAKIAAGTITLFLLSWGPYGIFAVAGIHGFKHLVTPYTMQVPVMFAKSSAIWNPIIYALSHPKFRAVLEKQAPFLLFCSGNVDREATSAASTNANKLKSIKSVDEEQTSVSEISEVEVKSNPAAATTTA